MLYVPNDLNPCGSMGMSRRIGAAETVLWSRPDEILDLMYALQMGADQICYNLDCEGMHGMNRDNVTWR